MMSLALQSALCDLPLFDVCPCMCGLSNIPFGFFFINTLISFVPYIYSLWLTPNQNRVVWQPGRVHLSEYFVFFFSMGMRSG